MQSRKIRIQLERALVFLLGAVPSPMTICAKNRARLVCFGKRIIKRYSVIRCASRKGRPCRPILAARAQSCVGL